MPLRRALKRAEILSWMFVARFCMFRGETACSVLMRHSRLKRGCRRAAHLIDGTKRTSAGGGSASSSEECDKAFCETHTLQNAS